MLTCRILPLSISYLHTSDSKARFACSASQPRFPRLTMPAVVALLFLFSPACTAVPIDLAKAVGFFTATVNIGNQDGVTMTTGGPDLPGPTVFRVGSGRIISAANPTSFSNIDAAGILELSLGTLDVESGPGFGLAFADSSAESWGITVSNQTDAAIRIRVEVPFSIRLMTLVQGTAAAKATLDWVVEGLSFDPEPKSISGNDAFVTSGFFATDLTLAANRSTELKIGASLEVQARTGPGAIPEPATLTLVFIGIVGLGYTGRRTARR